MTEPALNICMHADVYVELPYILRHFLGEARRTTGCSFKAAGLQAGGVKLHGEQGTLVAGLAAKLPCVLPDLVVGLMAWLHNNAIIMGFFLGFFLSNPNHCQTCHRETLKALGLSGRRAAWTGRVRTPPPAWWSTCCP